MVFTTRNRPLPLPAARWYPAEEAQVHARVLALGDDRVRVLEAGPAGGQPVVLLHGWGGCAYSFRRLLPVLAGGGYRAVAPDLLGHGGSSRPGGAARYAPARVLAHLGQLLDATGASPAFVVGQSMGGALALDLARAAPERVRGLVLLGSVGFTPIRRIRVARALRGGGWERRRVPRWVVPVMLRRVYGRLRTWEERDVEEYWAPLHEPGTVAALMGWVREYDWAVRPPPPAHGTPVPMQAYFGARDRLIPAARAVAHAARFAGATSEIVPEGGHLLAEEAPELVWRALDQLAARPGGDA